MDKIDDLKILKKNYGEDFAHLCRKLFPTILEHQGLLSSIILARFDASHTLYNEIKKDVYQFKAFIDDCAGGAKEVEFKPNDENLTPKQLMDRAGYILFDECKNIEQLKAFKKYYAKGEELCSFDEGKMRLKNCRVWFAIKKDWYKYNREDYENPQRQDEYGTSVISIQVARADGSISIKNRYNHKVENPDATFGNNLDAIIPGLAIAFQDTYNLEIDKEKINSFWLEDYEKGEDQKYYRVNARLNHEKYCENNVVLSYRNVIKFDKSRYILADNFIIDFEEKTIRPHFNFFNGEDSFVKSIGQIQTMTQSRDENGNRVIIIKPKVGDNVEIILNESNAIIGYKNPNVTEVGDNFMRANQELTLLYMPNLKKTGFYFLSTNRVIKEVSLESLEEAGDCFMENANASRVNLPNLKIAKSQFMRLNTTLPEASFPNLEEIGSEFFEDNISMKQIYLPKARSIEKDFFKNNTSLTEVIIPNVTWLPSGFLKNDKALKRLYAPQLDEYCLNINKQIANALVRTKSGVEDYQIDDEKN